MNKIGRNIYDIQNSRAINIDKKKRPSYKIYGDESKNTKYERTAIKSDFCDNILNQTFFSSKNVKIVQNGLRHSVWEKSGKKHIIGEQSETELVVVMRSIFLQFAKNLPDNILNFVPMNPQEFSNTIIGHKDLGAILFTGSSSIFDNIYKSVGNTNTKGGNIFIGKPQGGSRPAGVYRRERNNKLSALFISVNSTNYNAIFPAKKVVEDKVKSTFGLYLRKQLQTNVNKEIKRKKP